VRQLCGWLPVVMFVAGCSGGGIPTAPSSVSVPVPPGSQSALAGSSHAVDDGNWSPWYLPWYLPQAGAAPGERLGVNSLVTATVEANDICVPGLRFIWDARASCRRFSVSVESAGTLHVFLRWDPGAPDFDLSLAGDVVLVRPDGRFQSSEWHQIEVDVWGRVEPGEYAVLVMGYVPASLPFLLRTEFP
jgi:hypothetical protein